MNNELVTSYPSFFKEPGCDRYTAVLSPKEAIQVTMFGFLNSIEDHNIYGTVSDIAKLKPISEETFWEAYGKCEHLLRSKFCNLEHSHDNHSEPRAIVA